MEPLAVTSRGCAVAGNDHNRRERIDVDRGLAAPPRQERTTAQPVDHRARQVVVDNGQLDADVAVRLGVGSAGSDHYDRPEVAIASGTHQHLPGVRALVLRNTVVDVAPTGHETPIRNRHAALAQPAARRPVSAYDPFVVGHGFRQVGARSLPSLDHELAGDWAALSTLPARPQVVASGFVDSRG